MRKEKNKRERMKQMMDNLEVGRMIRKKETVIVLEIEIEREKIKEIILQNVLRRRHRHLLNHLHHHVNQEGGGISTVIGGRLLEASIIINAVVVIQNQDRNQLLLKLKLLRKNQLRIRLNIGIKSELRWVSTYCEKNMPWKGYIYML